MKINRAALGVSPGLVQANFVFGNLVKSAGVALNLADDLSHSESIAQQHLDFIQKLYFEQSYLGEYFEEIHLGSGMSGSAPESLVKELHMVELLAEQIQLWIISEQLDLVLQLHTGIATKAQTKYLSLNNAAPGVLTAGELGLVHAYSLWSFSFSETVDVVKSKVFKKYQAIDYPEMSTSIADVYLNKYKSDTIASFSKTEFRSAVIENERQQLLSLAFLSQSGKHQLLVCREKILEMLESQASNKSFLAESSVVGEVLNTAAGSVADHQESHIPLLASHGGLGGASVLERPSVTLAATGPMERESSNASVEGSISFLTSPEYTVSDNVPPVDAVEKTWHEPNARTRIRIEVLSFLAAIAVALVIGLYVMQLL